MSDYAIFFDYNNSTYRLPVNPEKLEITKTQANEKYQVLGTGQVTIPSYAELYEYAFSAEFPHTRQHYIETAGDFKGPDFYTTLFDSWRENKTVVRFIAHNGITKDINTLVLIESCTETENAGEDGDKYIEFKLLQYREFGKREVAVVKRSSGGGREKAKPKPAKKRVSRNPKGRRTYTVKRGDTLWAIARRYYGSGSKYPKIFNANRNKIRNPNLIYPGQVFVIP